MKFFYITSLFVKVFIYIYFLPFLICLNQSCQEFIILLTFFPISNYQLCLFSLLCFFSTFLIFVLIHDSYPSIASHLPNPLFIALLVMLDYLSSFCWLSVKSCEQKIQEGHFRWKRTLHRFSVLFFLWLLWGAWLVCRIPSGSHIQQHPVGGFNASSKGAPVGFPVSSAALPLLTPSHLLPYTGGLPTISKASFTSSFLMSFTDTQWEPPANSTLTTSIGPQPVGQFWLEKTCQTSLAFIDGSNHTLSNKI